MTYWDLVLKEITQKNTASATYQFIHRKKNGSNTMSKRTKPKISRQKYSLGKKYPKVTLTHQEAECMQYAVKGKTIPRIAAALKLSPRTVEYYFKKMRLKLKCHTKSELIERVIESDFLKAVKQGK